VAGAGTGGLAGADAGGLADAGTDGVAGADAGGVAGVDTGAEQAAATRPAASRTAAADTAAGRGKRLAALPAAVRMAEKAAGHPPAICSVMSVIRLIRLRAII
jgi:hypothetical protein